MANWWRGAFPRRGFLALTLASGLVMYAGPGLAQETDLSARRGRL
jgi:hypothetical protein